MQEECVELCGAKDPVWLQRRVASGLQCTMKATVRVVLPATQGYYKLSQPLCGLKSISHNSLLIGLKSASLADLVAALNGSTEKPDSLLQQLTALLESDSALLSDPALRKLDLECFFRANAEAWGLLASQHETCLSML